MKHFDSYLIAGRQIVALQIRIARLERIHEAKDFWDLWHHVENDQLYDLQCHYEDIFGRKLYLMGEPDKSDDMYSERAWQDFSSMIGVLEAILYIVNLELTKVNFSKKRRLGVTSIAKSFRL